MKEQLFSYVTLQLENGVNKHFYPDSIKLKSLEMLLEKKILSIKTGYVKINKSMKKNSKTFIIDDDKIASSIIKHYY